MKFPDTYRLAPFNYYSSVTVSLRVMVLGIILLTVLLGLNDQLDIALLSVLSVLPVIILVALGGFMVEFLVSMFIISLLITFAAPIYQTYHERAKIIESIGLMSGTKSNLTEYYSYYGHFPAETEPFLGIKTAGQYTTNITIDNGAVTAQLAIGHPELDGLSLSLRPALADHEPAKVIAWVCGYATPPTHFIVKPAFRASPISTISAL